MHLTLQQYQDIGWFGTPAPCGATATLLALFTAEGRDNGILLNWQFGPGLDVDEIVAHAKAEQGPWGPIVVEVGSDGEITTALDTSAEPGRTYFYQLSVTDRSGRTEVVGFVSGRRDAPPRSCGVVALVSRRGMDVTQTASSAFGRVRRQGARGDRRLAGQECAG